MTHQGFPGDVPFVSLVVPTFRRPTVLATTLVALLNVTYPADRHEIIVVDDGSLDDTAAVVRQLQEANHASGRLRLVQQDNCGAATARNRGARAAGGDVVIFVDDDMIVEPDHIRRHLSLLRSDAHALINGHWEFTPEVLGSLRDTSFGQFRLAVEAWIKASIVDAPPNTERSVPVTVTACNLGIWRDFFFEVGGFDDQFPFAGYEDQDFSRRAVAAGGHLYYDRSIRLLHNDQRVTLEQFCRRQRQGARTAVRLARKYPAEFGSQPLITANSPVTRYDAPSVVAKKLVKRSLASPPGLALYSSFIRLVERLWPDSESLFRLYWMMCGLHIFLGVRDGFSDGATRLHSSAPRNNG